MKTIAKKVFEEPLFKPWVKALLAQQSADASMSLYRRIQDAQQELRNAVDEARKILEGHPLLEMTTKEAHKSPALGNGISGTPFIRMLDDGVVVLSVIRGVKPTLQDLQEIAAQRDIDVSGMRKDEVEAALAGKQPKMVKTGLPPVKALDRTGMASRKPPEKVTLTTVPFEEGAGTPDP